MVCAPPHAAADSRHTRSLTGAPLGLDGAAILAARPAWLPDRWLGDMWLSAFVGLAVLLALGVGVASLNVPLPHPLGRLALSVGIGFTTFVIAAPLLGIYLSTLRYLD